MLTKKLISGILSVLDAERVSSRKRDLLKMENVKYYLEEVNKLVDDEFSTEDTGYRPFGTDSFRDLIKKYNSKAQEINKRPETWATIQKRLDINIVDF